MHRPLLSLLGLLLIAPTADASGVFLKWNACQADGGISARSFACDSNSGTETLVCSLVLDSPVAGVTGIEARIVGQSASGVLPAWWTFSTVACRPSSASLLTLPAGPVAGCPGLFGDLGAGGFEYKTDYPSSGGIQFHVAIAVGVPGVDAVAGQEYFLFSLRINHARTVGTGACSGCLQPMCLGVGYLQLTPSSSPFPIVSFPIDEGHLVSWQSGAPGAVYAFQVNPPLGHELDYAMTCDAVTPTRNSTWGAVKALYRP